MGIKELIDKLKAFIASAESSGAEIDPDSLAKGKELVGDIGEFVKSNEPAKAEDDELGDLGAEVYALIDTIDDRELAAKIKEKIEAARAAGVGGDTDPAPATQSTAQDDNEDILLGKLAEVFKGISPDEMYAFTGGLQDMANKVKMKSVLDKIQTVFAGGVTGADSGEDVPAADPAKKAATDSDTTEPAKAEEKPLTAQDANIIRTRAKQEARTETLAHIRSLTVAAHAVRGLCGEVDPLAFDSAADIYRHALKSSGRTVTTRDSAALRDMVSMALDAKSAISASRAPAFDSTEMSGPFAGLNNIKLG